MAISTDVRFITYPFVRPFQMSDALTLGHFFSQHLPFSIAILISLRHVLANLDEIQNGGRGQDNRYL